MSNMGVSKNKVVPPNHPIWINRVFPYYSPSILGVFYPQWTFADCLQAKPKPSSVLFAKDRNEIRRKNLKLQLEKYHTNPYIYIFVYCILYRLSIEYHTSTNEIQWNSYTYSTLHYNWKVPRSKHISFFCTGWSTSRIIKDHHKSLRRTALSPSLQSIRSSCAVARNSAVALDKACQKKTHWFLELKIWKFLSKTV